MAPGLGQYRVASVEEGLDEIRNFYREHGRADMIEQSGEIHSLEGWIQELRNNKPLSEKEKLEHQLQDAVRREDYEKAAAVRDALRSLEKG
jgi:protein-arginine kinase activator protein McsA